MTDPQVNAIKISLQIEVPLNGTPPIIQHAVAPSDSTALRGRKNDITRPRGDPSPTYVNLASQICIQGNALDDFGKPAARIHARVYEAATITFPFPSTPDYPSVVIVPDQASVSGFYQFDTVPVPGAIPGLHVVLTWAEWQAPATPPFLSQGVCMSTTGLSPYTDCTYPTFMAASPAASVSAPLQLEVFPVAWKLNAAGFSGGLLKALNGNWELHLVKSAGQKILYCSGGDGMSTPQIQLRCERPSDAAWDLSFSFAGKRVTYEPATRFDCQSRNVFQKPTSVGLAENDGIPAVVAILPA